MDTILKFALVYDPDKEQEAKEFTFLEFTLKKNAQVRVIETSDFSDFCERFQEFVIVANQFKDDIELDSFAFYENGKFLVQDGEDIYPNIDLLFVAKKYQQTSQLKHELLKVSEMVELEVDKLQKVYRSKVPLRQENISGLQFYSKFKTGSMPGGDFFDLIDTGESLQVIMCSTDSYLFNAKIIENVLEYKQTRSEEMEYFIEIMSKSRSSFKTLKADLLIFEIEKRTKKIKGYQFGGGDLFSNKQKLKTHSNQYEIDPFYLKDCYFEDTLVHDSKLLVSSAGVMKNWEQMRTEDNYYNAMLSFDTPQNALEGALIRLYEQNCIKYDISMIWIEVSKYDIRKI